MQARPASSRDNLYPTVGMLRRGRISDLLPGAEAARVLPGPAAGDVLGASCPGSWNKRSC